MRPIAAKTLSADKSVITMIILMHICTAYNIYFIGMFHGEK